MLVLAFDTATAAVTVALYEWCPGERARPLASADAVDRHRHAELLTQAIADVLAEAGAAPADLSAIAVGVGPGPYTGLRVGLVTARSLGEVLKIPVHGVCSLDVIAWASRRNEPFVVTTDARRKEVYWAAYDSARVRAAGPGVCAPDAVFTVARDAAKISAGPPAHRPPVIGEGAALHAGPLGGTGDPAPLLPSAGALAELAIARLSGEAGPPLLLPEPLYLRRPDARPPGARKKVTPA